MDKMQLSASDGDHTPESPGEPGPSMPDSVNPTRGACEACRSRKIRCDKKSPCLPCQRASIECVQPVIKRREKRTRILLTPQYERKIDLIDHRLEDLTSLLQDLRTHIPSTNHGISNQYDKSRHVAPTSSSIASSPSQTLPPEPTGSAAVEGESSLSAHSIFVSDFLQSFVQKDSGQHSDPEIQRTLDVLSDIVSASRQQPRTRELALPNARSQRAWHRNKYELPPIQKAVALIHAAKAQQLAGTGWVYEYILVQSFGDLCLQVYFSEDPSPFDLISVNAGLHSLLSDHAFSDNISQDEKDTCLAYARLCRDNLETGLADIPLHLPASANVIAALLFGAFYAIEFSTPSLSWSLTSKASELCQTLGYHRSTRLHDQTSESSVYTHLLFWTTYFLDKSLSLRLGRASTIPDWDITITPPTTSPVGQAPVFAFFSLWIKTARCQGNIYEMLYSPASIRQPDQMRQSKVNYLVASLREIEQETEKARNDFLAIAKQNAGDDLMNFYATSDDILRLSLLTHIYRAAPRTAQCSTTFSHDCIKVARATLDRHHDCMAIIHKTNDIYMSIYINWTLLFAPFVPFIVIFCHIMETRDEADLARLDAFVSSIHAAATHSESAAKMYRLFHALHRIALRYTELHMHHKGQGSSASAMDAQLAALGFPNSALSGGNHTTQTPTTNTLQDAGMDPSPNLLGIGNGGALTDQNPVNQILWTGNGMELEDWLYNNQASIEMLQGGADSV